MMTDDKSVYYELFSPECGVFHKCQEAVSGHLPPGWSAEILASMPLISTYGRENEAAISDAVRGLIDLTGYAANRGTPTSLNGAARALADSTVAVADQAGAARWLDAEGVDRDEAMRPALAMGTEVAATLALWARYLRAGVPKPAPRDSATVPVVLSLEQSGLVGSIRVFVADDGPPGLYPDPSTMAVTACDAEFRAAIRNAWELKGIPGRTVLWSVEADGTNDAFHGASAGAAFALALDELQRRRGRFGRVRYRRSSSKFVISAALKEGQQGELLGVGGLTEKFKGARDAGKEHVVLSEKNRADGAEPAGLRVHYATKLNDAIAITRRVNPMFLVTLAAAVFTLVALGVGGTFAAYKIDGANQRANVGKVLNAVDSLRGLAQQTGTLTLPDLQAKAQYLLTAYALASDVGRTALADQLAGSNLETSPGVAKTLDADLGNITGMYTVGGESVVASDKGKIMLVDSNTFDILGTYTLPPGLETLNQPEVKALASDPQSADFAVVSQVPVTGAAGTVASLEIFSSGSKLTLIGQTSGFTDDQVRDISYSPAGDKLIAVTATRAYFWDVSRATPDLTGSCALPTEAGAVPIALFPDPKTSRPLIGESNSSVQALSSWSLNEAGGTCETSTVTPAWAGKLANLDRSQLTPPTITAGTGAFSGAMVAAITASGQVKIRPLASGKVVTLPIKGQPEYVAGPYDDDVAVQLRSSSGTSIQVWEWDVGTAGKPVLEATYRGLQLPGLFPGGNDNFATTSSGEVVDALTGEEMTYPTGLLTLAPNAANATAASERSFAVVDLRTIAVYSLSSSKVPVYLTMPSGYDIAAGDDRFDNSVAMSQDGRYLAMILNPGTTFGQKITSPSQQIVVWNVASGLSTDITSSLGKPTERHHAFDIRFVPGTDDILVNYLDGTLVRAHPAAGSWQARDLLHASSSVVSFGMDIGPGGIYVIHHTTTAGTSTFRNRVLRYSYEGTLLKAWDFTSLDINTPSIAPLSDGGVLLIDNGGTAYHLRPDGAIGAGVDLNVQAVLEARQIPGTHDVLIASQGQSETYDFAHDVLATGESVGNSAQGVWDNFATTSDGRYLIGSDQLDNQTAIGALSPRDRLSNLCDLAGGSGMSPAQWAVYVGSLAPYTDPCASDRADIGTFYNAARQGAFSIEPELVQTPTSATAAALSASCADPDQANFAKDGDFAWGDVNGTEAICVNGTLKWVVPDSAGDKFQAGEVSGQTVLTVSGKITPGGSSTTNTVIDMLESAGVVETTFATDGTVTISPAGVDVTGTAGTLRVAETYGPDQHGYWGIAKAVPMGVAESDTKADRR